jgi:hypothetical protein
MLNKKLILLSTCLMLIANVSFADNSSTASDDQEKVEGDSGAATDEAQGSGDKGAEVSDADYNSGQAPKVHDQSLGDQAN